MNSLDEQIQQKYSINELVQDAAQKQSIEIQHRNTATLEKLWKQRHDKKQLCFVNTSNTQQLNTAIGTREVTLEYKQNNSLEVVNIIPYIYSTLSRG